MRLILDVTNQYELDVARRVAGTVFRDKPKGITGVVSYPHTLNNAPDYFRPLADTTIIERKTGWTIRTRQIKGNT